MILGPVVLTILVAVLFPTLAITLAIGVLLLAIGMLFVGVLDGIGDAKRRNPPPRPEWP
jgi:hypothetical protein